MPLIIEASDRARWLDLGADVTDLYEPHATWLTATAVSPYVNSPKHDDPHCIEPGTVPHGSLFT
jgi:putative SOS response-associated peptidase YedK